MGGEIGEQDFFLITDHARTHPILRQFRSNSVTLEEITSYSPDLNLIEEIWSLMEAILHKYSPELFLIKGPKNETRKAIEEVVTFCWELQIFCSLTEFIVYRIEAIMKADRRYTKY